MNNIEEVCKNLLDNADVSVNLSGFPDVLLHFVVVGMVNSNYWEVMFELVSVTDLSINKWHEDEYTPFDSYLVLEASVRVLEVEGIKSFVINVGHGGDFNFSANCVNFKWSAVPYSEEEFRKRNSYLFPNS